MEMKKAVMPMPKSMIVMMTATPTLGALVMTGDADVGVASAAAVVVTLR